MLTAYTVIRPDATEDTGAVDWPNEPDYRRIKALVEPLLGEREPGLHEPLEHVTVLYQGERRDMFVSELGHMRLTTREPLPINWPATKIYRAAALRRMPHTPPEELPRIAGVAVLFPDRQVWF